MLPIWNTFTSFCERHAALRKLLLSPEGKVILAQWPNGPLWLFIAFSTIHALTQGSLSLWSGYLEEVALAYWSALEIIKGANLFRRLLGLFVLLFIIFMGIT